MLVRGRQKLQVHVIYYEILLEEWMNWTGVYHQCVLLQDLPTFIIQQKFLLYKVVTFNMHKDSVTKKKKQLK